MNFRFPEDCSRRCSPVRPWESFSLCCFNSSSWTEQQSLPNEVCSLRWSTQILSRVPNREVNKNKIKPKHIPIATTWKTHRHECGSERGSQTDVFEQMHWHCCVSSSRKFGWKSSKLHKSNPTSTSLSPQNVLIYPMFQLKTDWFCKQSWVQDVWTWGWAPMQWEWCCFRITSRGAEATEGAAEPGTQPRLLVLQ